MNQWKTIIVFFIIILILSINVVPPIKSHSTETNFLALKNKDHHHHLESSQKIIEIINNLNQSLITQYLEKITTDYKGRVTGSIACSNAGEWIYNELVSIPEIKVRKFTWSSKRNIHSGLKQYKGTNIEAEITGSSNDSPIFILSAQYDVSNPESPGALDNGAGIAALLAVAKVLSEYTFHNTIRFIAFSGEEQGLLGSYAYAQEAYLKNEPIVAVLNADVIGNNTFENNKNYHLLRGFSTEAAKWIIPVMNQTCHQYNINLTVKYRNYKGHSDDKAFDDYGFPAMQLFQSGNNMESYYGSTEDTITLVNQSYLQTVTTCIAASLAVLANLTISPIISIDYPKENFVYIGSFNTTLFSHGNTVLIGKQPVQICIQTDLGALDHIDFAFVEKDNEMSEINEVREIVEQKTLFQPPYEWIIEGFYFGWYTLRVTAVNENGSSFTDEMEIFKIF